MWLLVVTELFNFGVNDFSAMKSVLAGCSL